jgi:hypothetical protein
MQKTLFVFDTEQKKWPVARPLINVIHEIY